MQIRGFSSHVFRMEGRDESIFVRRRVINNGLCWLLEKVHLLEQQLGVLLVHSHFRTFQSGIGETNETGTTARTGSLTSLVFTCFSSASWRLCIVAVENWWKKAARNYRFLITAKTGKIDSIRACWKFSLGGFHKNTYLGATFVRFVRSFLRSRTGESPV